MAENENLFDLLRAHINSSITSKYVTSINSKDVYDPISAMNTIDPVITICNHSFDRKMITEWIIIKRNCPICRTEFY